MVEHQESKYNWKFIFAGANIDAFSEGSSIGFSKTVQYVQTSSGINSLNADLVYSVGLARGYTEAVCLKTASDVGLDTQDLNDLLNT